MIERRDLSYTDLLIKYQPKVIENHKEYSQLIHNINDLMTKETLTETESCLLDLLVTIENRYLDELDTEEELLKIEREME